MIAHNLHKLFILCFLWITFENVLPLTQFYEEISSYIFLFNQGRSIFKRNSFIRYDAAFCFVVYFQLVFVSLNMIFFSSQTQFSKIIGDC